MNVLVIAQIFIFSTVFCSSQVTIEKDDRRYRELELLIKTAIARTSTNTKGQKSHAKNFSMESRRKRKFGRFWALILFWEINLILNSWLIITAWCMHECLRILKNNFHRWSRIWPQNWQYFLDLTGRCNFVHF